MHGELFRSRSPILSIYVDPDNHHLPLTIPQGTVVEVIEPDSKRSSLVVVRWDAKLVRMFSFDLQNRCDPVKNRTR